MFVEKQEKMMEIWEKNEESGMLAHPGLWGWLRPYCGTKTGLICTYLNAILMLKQNENV